MSQFEDILSTCTKISIIHREIRISKSRNEGKFVKARFSDIKNKMQIQIFFQSETFINNSFFFISTRASEKSGYIRNGQITGQRSVENIG